MTTDSTYNAKPLFISGIGRSGTSALLKAMALHPSVYSAEKIGEAPFISSFLNFLAQYENNSPLVDYNLKNYRLEANDRYAIYSQLMVLNQCGKGIDLQEPGKKYWIAKTSLNTEAYEKAKEIFGEVRISYIMRNGIEVINSARNFEGFAALSFEEHCRRWKENIESSEYLFDYPLVSVVKHDQLVADAENTFASIFSSLDLDADAAPADFINTNLFNSSFDETTKDAQTKKNFDNRLKAWDSWSAEEQKHFVDNCDAVMQKYDFVRPYAAATESLGAPQAKTASQQGAQTTAASAVAHTKSGAKNKLNIRAREIIYAKISQSYFDYVCNISSKYKYMFVNVPKVASTSILGQMQIAEDPVAAAEMPNAHDRRVSPLARLTDFSTDVQEEVLFGAQYKRISFVRNPFNRLLSAYLSKIEKPLVGWKVNPASPEVRPPKADILAIIQGKTKVDIVDMSPNVSFQEFLDVVASQDIVDMDIHWKPQFSIINPAEIDYDFVGRMENFNDDFLSIKKIAGITALNTPEVSANMTRSSEKLAAYYDAETTNQLLQVYSDDFEYFDYETSLKLQSAA